MKTVSYIEVTIGLPYEDEDERRDMFDIAESAIHHAEHLMHEGYGMGMDFSKLEHKSRYES